VVSDAQPDDEAFMRRHAPQRAEEARRAMEEERKRRHESPGPAKPEEVHQRPLLMKMMKQYRSERVRLRQILKHLVS
jgi:hypothetical protein